MKPNKKYQAFKIYQTLIIICLIILSIVVIYFGVALFFKLLYLMLKYPLYFIIPIVLFILISYIRKQFKTK